MASLLAFNDAFIISTSKKNELIAADPKSAELIRPILRGRDIKRYSYTFADIWLINAHNGIKSMGIPPIKIDDYPAIKKHLSHFYDRLASRADKGDTPYNLRNCVYLNEFNKQKIVYREISDAMNACMVEPGVMLNNKCYLITGSSFLEFLLAYFNSQLFTKIILPQANITGGKGEGFLNAVYSIIPTPDIVMNIHHLLEERASSKGERTMQIDYEIDNLFFDLYELSPDEIAYLQSL